MADVLAFTQLLGEAYMRSQVSGDMVGAVAALREAMADPEMHEVAVAEHARLHGVVKARMQGPRCGCHVSHVTCDLLGRALEDKP